MGNFFSALIDQVMSRFKKDARLVVLGLDGAGKTTLLYSLKLGEVLHTVPTIGFNVETVSYKNISFTMFDIGGQDKIRGLWRHYYQNNDAVIYVVDSSDLSRMDMCRDEMWSVLNHEMMRNIPVLVFANKQDMPGALTPSQVAQHMGLHKEAKRAWHVQGSNAIKQDGLYEGLDWLATTLNAKS